MKCELKIVENTDHKSGSKHQIDTSKKQTPASKMIKILEQSDAFSHESESAIELMHKHTEESKSTSKKCSNGQR